MGSQRVYGGEYISVREAPCSQLEEHLGIRVHGVMVRLVLTLVIYGTKVRV